MEVAALQIEETPKKSRGWFWIFYFAMCIGLLIASSMLIIYVWESVQEYENARPEYQIEQLIDDLKNGEGYELIAFPDLPVSEFTDSNIAREQYLDILKTASLSYRFYHEDYQTGEQVYYLYGEGEPVGRIVLKLVSQEQRLGLLHISHMQLESLEPVMDVKCWNYSIKARSDQSVLIHGKEVSEQYLTGEEQEIAEYAYVYEYADMPKLVEYQVDGLYEEAEVRIAAPNGQEVDVEKNGNQLTAITPTGIGEDTIPKEISQEVDVLEAAKTWSLFTTRDLKGAAYGLDQVLQYFIRDSYYWNKLREYAYGIDITLVSSHAYPTISGEAVSEYVAYTDNCFSCRIQFEKTMTLKTGKIQQDITDSTFYFVRIDDTEDGVDNPKWKIADIQAVVNR